MRRRIFFPLVFFSCFLCLQTLSAQSASPCLDSLQEKALLDTLTKSLAIGVQRLAPISIRNIVVNNRRKELSVTFNPALADRAFRPSSIEKVYDLVRKAFGAGYSAYRLYVYTDGKEISELVPAYYSGKKRPIPKGLQKALKQAASRPPLVRAVNPVYTPTLGLSNRHIALWQSHGYYYEQKLLRWEWQRARIFQTVEDLYTQSYVLPFLVPMLENAGAVVMMPRERDVQINEVIVDNDVPSDGYEEIPGVCVFTHSGDSSGFADTKAFYLDGENPFRMGTYTVVEALNSVSLSPRRKAALQAGGGHSLIRWTPKIPQAGEYAVYVSYKSLPNSVDDALYSVYHKGGVSQFKVNQQMGGGTWIYLGTFSFDAGSNPRACVTLVNATEMRKKHLVVTADAVRFGGGMGNMARYPGDSTLSAQIESAGIPPQISGYPRFTEGSRYWLHWAGFADSVYNNSLSTDDYKDDYTSRPRWVNALAGGSPFYPENPGYKIPIDLSFAFHSDAGTTLDDSIIGTLAIYTRNCDGLLHYPVGQSRSIARDYADIVQTQIVNDVRALFHKDWTRRAIWNRSYAESRMPQVPAMLLELLSHQNLADMRFGLDPAFRFTVSRAIYKGMLRFLSQRYGKTYCVQPLPVQHFSLLFSRDGQEAVLSWQPRHDPLEASAKPEQYIVYTRMDEGAFDAGRVVRGTQLRLPIEEGRHYSFKVVAANAGGLSFPSEILSLYKAPQEKGKVLIVNGFTMVSAPDSFATADTSRGGFTDYTDHGVPYLRDISYIGSQYEFRRRIPWMDDDSPGFGASYPTYETRVIAGNSFDYPRVHGEAAAAAGYSYCSVSLKALTQPAFDCSGYPVMDLILGKQKNPAFDPALQEVLRRYTQEGGNLLVSGAYVASDIWDREQPDTTGTAFAREVLKMEWRSNQASQSGCVRSCASVFYPFFKGQEMRFCTHPNERVYCVESPDAIEPASPCCHTIFRFADNNLSAGIAYKGGDYSCVVLGFPIEVIDSARSRNGLFASLMRFFE